MADMTISQGLRQVKKLKGQLAELQNRVQNSLTYRVSSPPAFSFKETFDKSSEVRNELISLESRIALANAAATVTSWGGETIPLVQAVRALQELKGQIAWLRLLPCRAQEDTIEDSYDYDEESKRVKVQTAWRCEMPEAKRAELVDDLQARFDFLNDAVERVNHVTTLP